MNVDELRRGIESMASEEYQASTYYERWSASLETLAGGERESSRLKRLTPAPPRWTKDGGSLLG